MVFKVFASGGDISEQKKPLSLLLVPNTPGFGAEPQSGFPICPAPRGV
jgi:hypothetical protein